MPTRCTSPVTTTPAADKNPSHAHRHVRCLAVAPKKEAALNISKCVDKAHEGKSFK